MTRNGETGGPPPDVRAGGRRSDRLPFALLAHPALQVVRMLPKLALPFFLLEDVFGQTMVAALLASGASHLALLGLDDAVIFARGLDAALWRRMRRRHLVTGLLAAGALAGLAQLLATGALSRLPGSLAEQQGLLADLLFALAPMVFLANLGVLPRALLLRERRHREAFLVDVIGVIALVATTILLAIRGAGPWSYVAGLYANAACHVGCAWALARPWIPREEGSGAGWTSLRRYRWQLAGTQPLGFVGEHLDALLVFVGLGPAAFALYEWARSLGRPVVNYVVDLGERLLFPSLAVRHRRTQPGATWAEVLRLVVTFVLPAHVLLALCAGPLALLLLPDAWRVSDAAGLLALLALAAGVRCCDVTATTALKAAGHSGAVLGLALGRMAGMIVVIVACIPSGVRIVAIGVLSVWLLSALTACLLASLKLPGPERGLAATLGLATFALWCTLDISASWLVRHGFDDLDPSAWLRLAIEVGLAGATWVAVRLAFDRTTLRREWSWVHAGFASRGGPS